MPTRLIIAAVLVIAAAAAGAWFLTQENGMSSNPTPPVARKIPKELVAHGQTRIDNYYWLRDDDRKNPKMLAYLEAENAYTKASLAHVEPLKKQLIEEMKARIKQDDASVPHLDAGAWYYTRFEPGSEHALHCRRKGTLEGTEEILLDGNKRSRGHTYYQVKGVKVSSDDRVLAFAEDTTGRRQYVLRFKDLSSGDLLADEIRDTSGNVAWALDGKTIFYVRREKGTLREYQVWRHVVGTPVADDQLVFEEKDETFNISVSRTRSRKFITIASHHTLMNECRVLDASQPDGEFEVFLPRENKHEYSIDHGGDRWFIRTNWDAKNFRLMSAPNDETADRSTWREEIPHRADVFLEDFSVFQDHLTVAERVGGQPGLRIIPRDGSDAWSIAFDEPVYAAEIGTNAEYATRTFRYDYTSLTTPSSVFDYDLDTRQATLKKQSPVLGGFSRDDYVSERLMAKARDGTAVPISLVYRKDLDRTQPSPLYLYAYGSYGANLDPWFSSSRLSLLDRGYMYAIAHVRGGQEFGRSWYEDGRLLKKRNTFTDFIDCSEHLVSKGYTSADKLIASGGSAGGLLVGAVLNMRPDLYGAVVADVPFVDVVTTMLDETIPLTTFEYDEWGNPNDKPYYDYMLSYSPYDNVEAKDYPHTLVLAGLHDSQVQYWEPAKWVARMRARRTDSNRLLLHTNMDAGHGGASGRFKWLEERAMEFAFLLDVIGR